jgi:hypothetical protein
MLNVVLTSALKTVLAAAVIVLLLIVELVTTMLVYIYLNLYHISFFGYLVRLASSVLEVLTGQLQYWLPISANAAYATLVGELGPKSILLLLTGLVMGVVVRSLARLVVRLTGHKSAATV